MAEKDTGPPVRKRKSFFEVLERKRQIQKEQSQTKVILGGDFQRWRALKQQKGLKTDALVAKFLLDSYEKLTKASSAVKSEPETSSPPSGPEQDHDEKPQLTTPSPLSGPLLAKCPSCGFALAQWCLQNGNTPNKEHQPESIEITLELEQKEDPVSGAEEADGDSDVSEEEEESEGSGVDEGHGRGETSDEDWTPGPHYAQTLTETNPTETAAAEEESGQTEPTPGKRKLCTECGVFYQKKPHECEHKTRPFVCNVCGRRFVSETALKIHSGIHSETYEHSCKYCYANFKTKADKLAHELIHQEQNDPYKCFDCAQTFPTFKQRTEHIKQHGNQFKCAICGIVFREKPRFLRHVVVHTGEKAYKCSVCERSFSQASHLKSHMRLHTGERPYSCKHCDKSFNHNVSLKSHIQRYHPTEREDTSGETHDMETEGEKEGNENKRGTAAKSKPKRPPTGRPKGRPKRNAAKKRKLSRTMGDSDDESE